MGANAQTVVPTFTAGAVLTAAQQNQINTGIPVFATTTTRDAAFGGAGEKTLAEGQFAYTEDTKTFWSYSGSVWVPVNFAAWTSFTPSLSNFSLGNGTLVGAYQQIGKLVVFRVRLAFGSTTSITSVVDFTLPVTPASFYNTLTGMDILTHYEDASPSVLYFNQPVVNVGGTSVRLGVLNTAGTYGVYADLSPTVPITWANNDRLNIVGSYEAA